MKIRLSILTAIICSLPFCNYAQQQDAIKDETFMKMIDGTDAISRQPILGDDASADKLFNLTNQQKAYYFRADLPDDNFLTIEFEKLSYWPGKGEIASILSTAIESVSNLRDSLSRNPAAGQKLALHVPANDMPVIAALHSSDDGIRYLVLKSDAIENVKVKMDTVTILKTFPNNGHPNEPIKVLYTFIMKDIKQLGKLKADPLVVADADNAFDSIVQQKRQRWHKQDAWYHSCEVEYNENATGKKLVVQPSSAFDKQVGVEANLGASFISTSIMPYADIGVSYRWMSNNKLSFVKAFASEITPVTSVNGTQQVGGLVYANLEIGAIYGAHKSLLPVYKTSVGFGYKVASNTSLFDDWKYRIFFNYSISKAITLSPDYYFSGKQNGMESKSFGGLTLTLRLF